MEKVGLAGRFALDLAKAGALSATEGAGGGESLKEAASQFEAMFLEKMLTSARNAYLKSDLGRGPQLEFYESLMDKQWAQHVAGRGLGLAEQIVSQVAAAQSYQGQADSADKEVTGVKGRLR